MSMSRAELHREVRFAKRCLDAAYDVIQHTETDEKKFVAALEASEKAVLFAWDKVVQTLQLIMDTQRGRKKIRRRKR